MADQPTTTDAAHFGSDQTDILRRQLAAIRDGLDGRLSVVVQVPGEAEARVDLDGGAVYSSASIIKLPILWSFFEQADRGTLDPLTWWALGDGDRVDGTGDRCGSSRPTIT